MRLLHHEYQNDRAAQKSLAEIDFYFVQLSYNERECKVNLDEKQGSIYVQIIQNFNLRN